jgi:hypothetical protein
MRKVYTRLIQAIFYSLIGFTVFTLISCGGGSGDGGGAAPTINATGTWRGNVIETVFGASQATLILVQNGSSVTGTYTSTGGGTGSASGSVSGNVITGEISPTGCTGTMHGTLTVTTNATGQDQMAFSASGIYTCGSTTYNNTATGILIW